MPLTAYHAKLFAYELTKRSGSDSVDKLASALSDAQVDLNPHQIEAALFAFRSPVKLLKRGSCWHSDGPSGDGGYLSSARRIFASNGIRNFQTNSFSRL
jgi:hypothetical protein